MNRGEYTQRRTEIKNHYRIAAIGAVVSVPFMLALVGLFTFPYCTHQMDKAQKRRSKLEQEYDHETHGEVPA